MTCQRIDTLTKGGVEVLDKRRVDHALALRRFDKKFYPVFSALPNPSVSPVPTLAPPACVDGMKFVADVSYGDNNMKNPPFVTPKEGFVKTWRLQNTGTCTWTPKYQLVYAYGNVTTAQMSGQPVNIPANVAPRSNP